MSNAMSYCAYNFNYPGQAVAVPIFPAIGDDVYINHSVTVNGAFTLTINNLYVSGSLLFDNTGVKTLNIKGDVQATGVINLTSTQTVNFNLQGVNNYIGSFTSGSTSIVGFIRAGDQPVMNINYWGLLISGIGTKTAESTITTTGPVSITSGARFDGNGTATLGSTLSITGGTFNLGGNTTVAGAISITTSITGGNLNLLSYDFTASSTTTVNSSGALSGISKTGAGAVIFIGLLSCSYGNVVFTGNPTIEFRNGYTMTTNSGFGVSVNFGTGTISATTNSQTFSNNGVTFTVSMSTVLIVGAITVTIAASSVSPIQIESSIDGTVAGSTLVNRGLLYFNTTTLPMATNGVWDFASFSNTVGYVMSSTFTLPHTTYKSLYLSGTGAKTLANNTTVNVNATVVSTTIDLSTYDLTIVGTTSFSSAQVLKTSSGSILFTGLLTISGTSSLTFDFTGNPSIELRGGLTNNATALTITGSPTISATTNNQTFTITSGFDLSACNLLISGAIVVTFTGANTFTISGTIDGNNASSKLDNRLSPGGFLYKNTTLPMVTGILECDAAANVWKYNKAGNQDVKGGNYRTLELGGSGVKTLQGNVDWITAYSLTGTATLDLNGYTLS